jgi:DNA-binding NarL/FixJ family response regulator
MAMQSGACGYLLKTVRHDELAAAIRRVHAGEALAEPWPQASPPPRRGPLTQREIEVLGFIRQGFSNDEIARLMGISERTVRAHITSILASLQAADRAQAVAIGFELGILKLASRS